MAKGLIAQAIESMPDGDRAAIVVFWQECLVERLASEEQRLAQITLCPGNHPHRYCQRSATGDGALPRGKRQADRAAFGWA